MSAATQTSPVRPTRPPRPRLRLVEGLRSATKISRRGVWIAVAIVILAFGLQLLLSMVIIQDAYLTDELEQQHLELEREHTAALEITDVQQSPQHLAEQATELGMVPASDTAFLDLEAQTVTGGDTATEPREQVDPSLVPNAILNPEVPDEQSDANGESSEESTEPAVPSEFEMSSPNTR